MIHCTTSQPLYVQRKIIVCQSRIWFCNMYHLEDQIIICSIYFDWKNVRSQKVNFNDHRNTMTNMKILAEHEHKLEFRNAFHWEEVLSLYFVHTPQVSNQQIVSMWSSMPKTDIFQKLVKDDRSISFKIQIWLNPHKICSAEFSD